MISARHPPLARYIRRQKGEQFSQPFPSGAFRFLPCSVLFESKIMGVQLGVPHHFRDDTLLLMISREIRRLHFACYLRGAVGNASAAVGISTSVLTAKKLALDPRGAALGEGFHLLDCR